MVTKKGESFNTAAVELIVEVMVEKVKIEVVIDEVILKRSRYSYIYVVTCKLYMYTSFVHRL